MGAFLHRNERTVIAVLSNPKWEAFCLHYAKTGNASEAYRQSGYSCKNEGSVYTCANRLLQKVEIKGRVAEIIGELSAEKIADIREIHEYLTSVIRGETTDDVVVTEGCGDGVSEAKVVKVRTANAQRIKAATELAKMKGAYDNRLRVDVTIPVFGGEDSLAD
jgi:phage terminase small subunit